jgi:hypothetical protein
MVTGVGGGTLPHAGRTAAVNARLRSQLRLCSRVTALRNVAINAGTRPALSLPSQAILLLLLALGERLREFVSRKSYCQL